MTKLLIPLLVLGLAQLSLLQHSDGAETIVQSDSDAGFWLNVAVRLEALGQPKAARQALVVARRLGSELVGVNESLLRLDMTKCPRPRLDAADMTEECEWWWDDGTISAEHDISAGGDDLQVRMLRVLTVPRSRKHVESTSKLACGAPVRERPSLINPVCSHRSGTELSALRVSTLGIAPVSLLRQKMACWGPLSVWTPTWKKECEDLETNGRTWRLRGARWGTSGEC
eukprot:659169-Rhodomonas_salina.2